MMYLGNQAVGMATSLPVFGDKVMIEYGEYTPQTDEQSSEILIPHSLGVLPDFLFYTTEGLDIPNLSDSKVIVVEGYINNLFHSNNDSDTNYIFGVMRYDPSSQTLKGAGTTTTQEKIKSALKLTDSSFCFSAYLNYILKANIKYKYIIGKFKEVTSNAS